jgi:hypothetical protein
VFPGDELTVSMWTVGDGEALFRTAGPEAIVIDRGRLTYHAA